MMNPFQKVVTRSYGGGDYAHLADYPLGADKAEHQDDTLFVFLIRELADDGDPMTKDLAIQRIENGIEDMMTALREIKAMRP
jgi:hypothetical protein